MSEIAPMGHNVKYSNKLLHIHKPAILPRNRQQKGVCLSPPPLTAAADYSYTFQYRHASQTKEGAGVA